MTPPETQPQADPPHVAPEALSGASLFPAGPEAGGSGAAPEPFAALPPLPPLTSDDGRVHLTDRTLTVLGREFLLLELERVEITPVKWILWYLLGGLGLAFVMIAFLQNQLRTGPAMLGMVLTALLLAYGHRGTNRLRLHRLGREVVNVALPGDPVLWQRLMAEANRRIFRQHDHAAREAAAVLAAADEAARQAAAAARLEAEAQEFRDSSALSTNEGDFFGPIP